jgi:hypothetical protein
MYALGSYLFRQRVVAFLCGVLFMFSSYRMIHATEHLPILLSSFLVPLFTLCLFKAAQRLTIGRSTVCALILALSTGISWYCTISLFIFLAVFLVHARYQRQLGRLTFQRLRSLAIGCVVFVVISSPFTLPLLLHPARGEIVNRSLGESHEFTPDLLAFFIPSPRHALLGTFVAPLYEHFTGIIYEQTAYIGYIILVLAGVAVLKDSQGKRGLFLLSAATFFILALGPLLHVNGKSHFDVDGVTMSIPLPYLLLHYIPVLNGVRVPTRFNEMVIFSLVVLAGYGLSALRARLRGKIWQGMFYAVLCLGISLESAAIPLPTQQTAVPQVYFDIARAPEACSILEVPLDWRIIKYHYYQAIHGKRLLIGHPVRTREKYTTYLSGLPVIPIFRDPHVLLQDPIPLADPQDAARLVAFFNICYVVIHRDYLDPAVVERVDQFVHEHFRYTWRWADAAVIAYALSLPTSEETRWPEDYYLDFGAPQREFVLRTGWSQDEQWGPDLTVQWSDAPQSSVYLFLDQIRDRVLEMRLAPSSYTSAPPQGVSVYVNGTVLQELLLGEGWHVYQVQLPAAVFVRGLNSLTFTYRYTARPVDTMPGSTDPRALAVAFDYLALRGSR